MSDRNVSLDWFEKSFVKDPDPYKSACRHAAYLLNAHYDQTDRYEQSLETILARLKQIPGVELALDIQEILGEINK